ncbi:MAG TPA: DinB family protein [Dehalococcoidia bacterium]|nr:DinB family protein [Dehalococcoidia bacterium]
MPTANDSELRQQLLGRLSGRGARTPFEEVIKDFPMSRINEKFPNGAYSSYALVEHLRRGQWDILDYIHNPDYKELEWPKDYWPEEDFVATPDDWDKAVEGFLADTRSLEAIVKDTGVDLASEVATKGSGHTILREILLICDHNSYHIGEFGIMRQVMGTWGER